jgi:chorismate mutase/prephenate dehydrogenase
MTHSADDKAALANFRRRLSEIDSQLIELVGERLRLGEQIGHLKRSAGQPTRDFEREKEVLGLAHARAEEAGVPSALAESLVRSLIHSSLSSQEQARVVAEGTGNGRRALVIGGGGRMGRWFVGFLDSQGFRVEISDPHADVPGHPNTREFRRAVGDQDMIVVAAPLAESARILEELAAQRATGLIFDIGSLKTPLRAGLEALVQAGCRVTSLHPMFGPDTDMLSGRHVIFVDVGVPEATAEARTLFASTMAEAVDMDLDAHDRLVAYVLGLSHALNIAFFTALADSGESAPMLARLSSTTFDAQLEIASKVADENPRLYYEIQALNAYGREPLEALRTAVERILGDVTGKHEERFVETMRRGRAYFESRR